jgi:hypothetical protein
MEDINYSFCVNAYSFENKANLKDLLNYDRYAQQDIERLESIIKELKKYRKALYNHVQEVQSMSTSLKLSLTRRKNYNDKVFYYLLIEKVYGDNMTVCELSETYAGTERHKAIARVKELQKQYVGIETEINIEKSRWER